MSDQVATEIESEQPSTGAEERHARLAPGVVDAGMSSLATFVAALVAASTLSDVELGVYAVFYTAFNFGQVIGNNLAYIPAEVVVVSWPVEARLRALPMTTRLALGPSLVGASAIAIAVLITLNVADMALVGPLSVTAAITTFLWPTQDHVRRMLHIAGLSWQAATVSVVQFVTVVASIGVLLSTDIPQIWIPYGSLAIANLTSLLAGGLLARRYVEFGEIPQLLKLRDLAHSGAWLLVGVGAPTVSAMGAAAIITFMAGPEVLGYAEAARIASQPVLVLGIGLGFVLGPRIMRGAIERDASVSRTNHIKFNVIVVAAALLYIAVAGWNWPGNPMAALLPNAFVVSWLVPATVVSQLTLGTLGLLTQELMAAGRARAIGLVGLLVAPFQLMAAATAGAIGAMARPLSVVVGTSSRLVINGRTMMQIYAGANDRGLKASAPGADDGSNGSR